MLTMTEADPQYRIMIVDDSSIMRDIIATMFDDDDNFAVCAKAENGEHALALLTENQPHLIFLDVEMPKMNGLEFLRHARLKSRAKIVILSSVTGPGSEKALEALNLGADAVISKPSGAVSFDLEQRRGSSIRRVAQQLLQQDNDSASLMG